mgnify:CR=1 FL=1
MELKTIDMTPSWEATASILIAIMENGNDTSFAKDEITRMGKIIDYYIAKEAAK